MRRPILGPPGDTSKSVSHEPRRPRTAARSTLQGPKLQQRLRQARSAAYVEAMRHLDAHTHRADPHALQAVLEAIANEFPELGIDQQPLGIVQRCLLGTPYEVHVCDLSGSIVEHYETFRAMPAQFERARALALHPSYAFIEVYPDALRAVAFDGSVSVIH